MLSTICPTLPDAACPPSNTRLAKPAVTRTVALSLASMHQQPTSWYYTSVSALQGCQDTLYRSSETRALDFEADVHLQSPFPDGEMQLVWCDMTLLSLHWNLHSCAHINTQPPI